MVDLDDYIEAYIKKRIRMDLRLAVRRELVINIYGLDHYRDYYVTRSLDTPLMNFKEHMDKKVRSIIDYQISKNDLVEDFLNVNNGGKKNE
jgi:hypothetical protein